MDPEEDGVQTGGGQTILICLGEARDLLLRLCGPRAQIVELRTADGRPAFVASMDEHDARRFMDDPRSAGLVLGRE